MAIVQTRLLTGIARRATPGEACLASWLFTRFLVAMLQELARTWHFCRFQPQEMIEELAYIFLAPRCHQLYCFQVRPLEGEFRRAGAMRSATMRTGRYCLFC